MTSDSTKWKRPCVSQSYLCFTSYFIWICCQTNIWSHHSFWSKAWEKIPHSRVLFFWSWMIVICQDLKKPYYISNAIAPYNKTVYMHLFAQKNIIDVKLNCSLVQHRRRWDINSYPFVARNEFLIPLDICRFVAISLSCLYWIYMNRQLDYSSFKVHVESFRVDKAPISPTT